MDADAIMQKQLRQMEKERREKETKLKTQEKKVGDVPNWLNLLEFFPVTYRSSEVVQRGRAFYNVYIYVRHAEIWTIDRICIREYM